MGLSSNILWHQTNKDAFEKILKARKLTLGYSREKFFDGSMILAFPMVSLCDLPFSEMGDYLGKYGDYTIGFSREWGKKNAFTPVWYCETDSESEFQLKEMLSSNYRDAALDILAYVKPVEGELETKEYVFDNYRYYDEREVRIVPINDVLRKYEIPRYLESNEYEQYKKDHGGSPLIPLYISFEWSDIKYLIVWRENQIEPLRKKLEKFGCDNHSIGIFSQNRIKHDFIGVAHNVGRKKKNIERAQKMRDMEATIKSQEESRQQLKQSLENILKQL